LCSLVGCRQSPFAHQAITSLTFDLGFQSSQGTIAGKPASIRVYPLALLDRAPAWGLELEPTKQAHLFALGYDRRTQKRYLAVAVRRTRVVVLQIDDRGLFPKIAVRREYQVVGVVIAKPPTPR